jgi:hypothetical protein
MPLELKLPSVKKLPKSTANIWARMKYWAPILLTINFMFLIATCGLDIEDPSPPSRPQWVPKSLPEEWPETGIDARDYKGIVIEWGSDLTGEVVGYFIYRAEGSSTSDSLSEFEERAYRESHPIENNSYSDIWIESGIPYHYFIIAMDASGGFSENSDTVSYTWLAPIREEHMIPNGLTVPLVSGRELQWYYSYYLEMEKYCITVTNEQSQLVIRDLFLPSTYTGHIETWVVPDSIILNPGEVYKWRIDALADFINGREASSSESQWAYFLYTD